jgi:hypothetical protein
MSNAKGYPRLYFEETVDLATNKKPTKRFGWVAESRQMGQRITESLLEKYAKDVCRRFSELQRSVEQNQRERIEKLERLCTRKAGIKTEFIPEDMAELMALLRSGDEKKLDENSVESAVARLPDEEREKKRKEQGSI